MSTQRRKIKPSEVLKRFYGFVKQATEGPYEMIIRDVMDTSWEDLMEILGMMETSQREEVIDLADLLGTI